MLKNKNSAPEHITASAIWVVWLSKLIYVCVCVFIYRALKRRWLHGTIAVTSGMNHSLSELDCAVTGHFTLSNGHCFLQGHHILLASHTLWYEQHSCASSCC